MKKIVIVGGVAGGASCAARLRRLDEEAEIVILERGDYVSYANCGLPYHISNVIRPREMLLLHTPESLHAWFDVDVRVRSNVTAIDREAKTVTVTKTDTGETYEEAYDKLVLATGSSPLRPSIPGIESDRVETLWTIPDTDRIKAKVEDPALKTVAVIGGGFIGLEMVENLVEAGKRVALVEAQDQVMGPVDFEMAQILHGHLTDQGVDLHLGDGVASFQETVDGIEVVLQSGERLAVDMVILSIGVRPNSELAVQAGLEVNARGGIVTNKKMETSDPDIYAVGDVVQVDHFVTGEPTMVPLAGPANKQGRIAADQIAGLDATYTATQGTSVAKVFRYTVASTGLNEKQLQAAGKEKGKDYETVTIAQNSHAGYYPGAQQMILKLLFTADGSKILGAQGVGQEGVDKRIDVLATAQRLGASVTDLKDLELAYAPPYSSAKDPVNMLGFVAENLLEDRLTMTSWDVMEAHPDYTFLDVREDEERKAFSIPHAKAMPLGTVRDRLDELDKETPVVVFCAIGVRANNAARVLRQSGFKDVSIYPGGAGFYIQTHYDQDIF